MHTKILAQVNQELQLLCASRNAILTLTQPCESGTKDYQLLLPLTQDDWDNIEDDKFTRPGSTLSFKPNAVRKLGAELTFANRLLTISIKDASAVTVDEQLSAFPIIPTLQQRTGTNTVLHHIKFDTNVSSQEFEEVANGLSQVYGDALGLEPADVCFTNQQSILFSFSVHPVDKCFGENLGGTRDSFSLEQLEQFRRSERQPIKPKHDEPATVIEAAMEVMKLAGTVKANWFKAVEADLKKAINRIQSKQKAPTQVIKLGSRFAKYVCAGQGEDSIRKQLEKLKALLNSQLLSVGIEQKFDAELERGITQGLEADAAKVGKHFRTFKGEPIKVRYMSEAKIDTYPERILIVNAPINCGKTTETNRYIDSLGEDARVIAIDYRRKLVAQRCANGNFRHFAKLKEDETYSDISRLAITVDSLYKLMTLDDDFLASDVDCLVIDEAPALFHYLFSSTHTHVNDKRRVVLDTLASLLRFAKKVILTSADLGNLDVELVKHLSGAKDSDIRCINNEFKTGDKKIFVLPTEDDMMKQLEQTLSEFDGERRKTAFIYCHSAALAEQIHATLKEFWTGECITRHSNHKLKARADRDLQKFCESLQYLVVSPVWNSGVDISFKHFDTIFGFFDYDELSFLDSIQGIGRVRNPISNTIYIWDGSHKSGRSLSNEFIKQRFRIGAMAVSNGMVIVDPKSPKPTKANDYYAKLIDFQVRYLQRHAGECINRKQKTIAALAEQGHDVTILDSVEKPRLTNNRASNTLRKEWSAKVADAPKANDDRAEELKSWRMTDDSAFDEAAEAELVRYEIASELELEQEMIDADLVYWFLYGNGKKVIEAQAIINMSAKEAYQRDVSNINARGWQGLGSEFNQKKREALLAVKHYVDLVEERGCFYSDDSFLSDFMAEVERYRVDLKEFGIGFYSTDPVRTFKALCSLMLLPIADGKRSRIGGTGDYRRTYEVKNGRSMTGKDKVLADIKSRFAE